MAGHRPWRDIRAGRERRIEAEHGTEALNEHRKRMDQATTESRDRYERQQRTLAELRKARELTQIGVGERLGVSQPQVSRIENSADLYLSTLHRYVEALEGTVEIVVRFPDGEAVPLDLSQLLNNRDTDSDEPTTAVTSDSDDLAQVRAQLDELRATVAAFTTAATNTSEPTTTAAAQAS